MIVRPALESDLPSIIHLDALSNPHPWGEPLVADALLSRKNWVIESTEPVLNQENSNLLGWLTASQVLDQSELELIVIDIAVRRQGLAKKLMTTWLEETEKNDVIEYLLEVRESNIGAIMLYESLGFEQVGRRKNYYKTEQGHEAACLFTLKAN